jgi:hypothetical protein
MADNIEVTRPSVESNQKTTEAIGELDALRHASDILIQHANTDEYQQNDASLTNSLRSLHLPETSDCSIQKTKAIASSDSTVFTMSDNHDISDTSTIHSNAQYEAVTETFGNALSDNDGLRMG